MAYLLSVTNLESDNFTSSKKNVSFLFQVVSLKLETLSILYIFTKFIPAKYFISQHL